jgi:hypothetical protein
MTSRRSDLPAIDRALADLAETTDLVTALALLRDPSTTRPWRERHLDADARAEADYEARAERADADDDAPGEHPDAARADVLDALSGVLWRAEDLAHHLSRAAWCPTLPPAPADADPRPYLRHAAACLVTAVTAWTNGREIAHWAADRAAEIRADLDTALALNIDGQTVKALCPWCRGGLTGAYTWRVRVLPGGEPAIVCESGLCQPPSRDVTTWWGGTPVWPLRDWPWLAHRLTHLDERRQAAAPPSPRAGAHGSTGRAGSIPPDGGRSVLRGVAPDQLDNGYPQAG